MEFKEAILTNNLSHLHRHISNDPESTIFGADEDGCTALFVAATCGNGLAVKVLLEHKAKVDAQTLSGVTPLCAVCANTDDEILSMLLEVRAVFTCKSKDCCGLPRIDRFSSCFSIIKSNFAALPPLPTPPTGRQTLTWISEHSRGIPLCRLRWNLSNTAVQKRFWPAVPKTLLPTARTLSRPPVMMKTTGSSWTASCQQRRMETTCCWLRCSDRIHNWLIALKMVRATFCADDLSAHDFIPHAWHPYMFRVHDLDLISCVFNRRQQ